MAPRTANGRATRARIIQAAVELIAQNGVAGTSLDDVRAKAQASKSQLYLYFDDRDALLRGVAEATCDAVIDSQAELFADFGSMAGVERYLDAIVALQVERDSHGGCRIGSLAGQLVESDDAARVILADGMDRWEAALRDGFEAMSQSGELRDDVDPSLLATKALAVIQGGLLLTQVHRDPKQIRIAADAVLELISPLLSA